MSSHVNGMATVAELTLYIMRGRIDQQYSRKGFRANSFLLCLWPHDFCLPVVDSSDSFSPRLFHRLRLRYSPKLKELHGQSPAEVGFIIWSYIYGSKLNQGLFPGSEASWHDLATSMLLNSLTFQNRVAESKLPIGNDLWPMLISKLFQ